MPKLIKDNAIVEDPYVFIQENEDGSLTLPSAPVLVKLGAWQRHRDALMAHPFPKGIQLAPDEFAEEITDDIGNLDLVAVEFPQFADGRGYSTGSLLRSRLGFRGELRAVGDVIKDTLFYQQRCGFNAFAVRQEKGIEDALTALSTFSVCYQGAIDRPPLYRMR
jgi:uncharacterized protein (DUF934 family)